MMYYAIAHLDRMYKIFDITEHHTEDAALSAVEMLLEEYADRPAVRVSAIKATGLVDLVETRFKDCAFFSIHSMKQAQSLGWDRPEVRDAYQAVRRGKIS